MISPWTPPEPGLSLFGKTKMRADFVALNTRYPAAERLQRWLEAGFEAAAQAGKSTHFDKTWQFLVCEPDLEWAMVGLLLRGQDRVHRQHPVWLAAPLPATLVRGEAGALVPLACARAFTAMKALAASLDATPLPELKAALTSAPVPTAGDFDAWLKAPRAPLAREEAAQLRTAWTTAAASPAAGSLTSPLKAGPLQEYPATSSAGVYCWLALHARCPPASAAPSYFWSSQTGQLKLGCGVTHPSWFIQLLLPKPPSAVVAASTPPQVPGDVPTEPPSHDHDRLAAILDAVPCPVTLDSEEA